MTEARPFVVLEIVRGPLDGTRLSAKGPLISVGTAEADDISLPGYWDEDEQLRLRVLSNGGIEFSARYAVSVNGVVIGASGSARVGDIVGLGLAELALIAVSDGESPTDGPDAGTATPSTAPSCPRCGASNSPRAPWCGACGRDLPAEHA